jgi:alkane 1-monooxygenase
MATAALAYRDPKKPLWLLSLLVPALAGAGPVLYLLTHAAWTLWLPVALVYIALPCLDAALGVDVDDPPNAALKALENDRYYRLITWMIVPLLWLFFIAAAWFYATVELPLHAVIALLIATGVVGGFCINVGHELGHQSNSFERTLAKLILAPTAYGHFFVEHNRGHHRDVATPADPASARFNESIYRFALREWPGGWRRAWRLEQQRLQASGRSAFHLDNALVQTGLITVVLWSALTLWLGWAVLPFIIAAAAWANFQLTSANYIEHYGIARKKLSSGRYEPCQPRHSWNANQRLSNWALFHLQRHSDHHAHATRRYQTLRAQTDAPQLPTGYFGMFLMSYVPPLFFRVMNPRLLALSDGDPERINRG